MDIFSRNELQSFRNEYEKLFPPKRDEQINKCEEIFEPAETNQSLTQ